MPAPILSDAQVRAAARSVARGAKVVDVAARLGVAYNTLWRRLSRLGGGVVSHRSTECVYRARCPSCGEWIRASQIGEGDAGWRRWVALAGAHGRHVHGVPESRLPEWVDATWSASGDRIVRVSIPGDERGEGGTKGH